MVLCSDLILLPKLLPVIYCRPLLHSFRSTLGLRRNSQMMIFWDTSDFRSRISPHSFDNDLEPLPVGTIYCSPSNPRDRGNFCTLYPLYGLLNPLHRLLQRSVSQLPLWSEEDDKYHFTFVSHFSISFPTNLFLGS